ncbi:MAG: hypothetical protein KGJ13_12170, partial [Patescibacteria group bacterium]|nr:hypothetical protein [Patescibacteria group bacterium]
VPVFIARDMLSIPDAQGKLRKGDRVTARKTHYLSHTLRTTFLRDMYRSKTFDYVTVRSLVDAYVYAENKAKAALARDPNWRRPLAELTRELLENFYGENQAWEIEKAHEKRNIQGSYFYTNKEYFGKKANDETHVIGSITQKLKQKHESAAVELADELRFQIYPANYVTPPTPRKSKKTYRASLKRK